MQYMFGPSILVAPVMNPEGRCRYYLPAGKWYPLLGGKAEEGPGWRDGEYDYFSLPLYVREGAVIRMREDGRLCDHHFGNACMAGDSEIAIHCEDGSVKRFH